VVAGSRYPLEAARTLRAEEELAAKHALAARLDEQRRAEEAATLAEKQLDEHRRETARITERERAADGAGRAVGETLRATAWLKRRNTEAEDLSKALHAASQTRAEARAASDRARAALADARAAREAVEKHHEAWLASERRAEEARAEAEIEDVMAGRRSR
jgi:hypothetical protein